VVTKSTESRVLLLKDGANDRGEFMKAKPNSRKMKIVIDSHLFWVA